MKATEQYFPVVLFITLYMVVGIPRCDHSNETHKAVLSDGAVMPYKMVLLLSLWMKCFSVCIENRLLFSEIFKFIEIKVLG